MKVGDIIQVYWHDKLIKVKIMGFKHGVPNIKIIKEG